MGHSREESGSCRGPREQERPGRGWRPTQEDKLLSELLSGATPATSASLHEGAAPGPAPSEQPVSLTPPDAPATLRGAGTAGPSPGAPWSRRVQPTQPAARLLSRADGGTQRRPPVARCREESREETRAGDLGVNGDGHRGGGGSAPRLLEGAPRPLSTATRAPSRQVLTSRGLEVRVPPRRSGPKNREGRLSKPRGRTGAPGRGPLARSPMGIRAAKTPRGRGRRSLPRAAMGPSGSRGDTEGGGESLSWATASPPCRGSGTN